MRKLLDGWYLVCGWLAATSMALMAVLVIAQVIGRLFSVVVPSVIQLSGFLLAATIFLSLAYAMAAGDHIRVTIVLDIVSRRVRLWLEVWCLLAGLLITVYLLVFSIELTWDSFSFGDKADGLLAVPLWIPQLPMVIGTFSLAVRLVDELAIVLRTGRPVHIKSGEQEFLEDMLGKASNANAVEGKR